MKPYYDYIIVGAGPAGLSLAQYLKDTKNSILIIDSIDAIGGCHRVVRVPFEGESLFTEHGPRIYVSNYKNFQFLLKEMDHDFDMLFTPYRYSIQGEMLKRMRVLSFRELLVLAGAFLMFLTDENYGKKSTIDQFGKKHNFSPQTMDTFDRLARMTDGSGSDRYTINTLFQLINQSFFYKVYQPKSPNDTGLFRVWENFLRSHKNIDIVLEHDVINIGYNKETNSVQSIWAVDKKNHNTIEIKCHNVILAVPPHAIARIVKTSHDNVKNSFMPYQKLTKFVENTDYIKYISITFHWKTKQDNNIPHVHGFPTGEWGVLFIVLSDYMDMTDEYSKTLISCGVSYLDRPSTHTEKTANQSSPDEVIEETFRQLKMVMPFLPKPDVALISPQNTYDTKQKKWTQYDVSYFHSMKEKRMKNNGIVDNLYNVGTQNGHNLIDFTTLESAVSNSWFLACKFNSNTSSMYPFQKFWTLRKTINILVVVLLVLLIIIIVIVSLSTTKTKKNKSN
jgi:protoporphyrinogen oxidase